MLHEFRGGSRGTVRESLIGVGLELVLYFRIQRRGVLFKIDFAIRSYGIKKQ